MLMSLAPTVTDYVMINFMGDESMIYKDAKNTLADGGAIEKEKRVRLEEERHKIQMLFHHFDADSRCAAVCHGPFTRARFGQSVALLDHPSRFTCDSAHAALRTLLEYNIITCCAMLVYLTVDHLAERKL